jgi:hypothetical protein
MAGKQPWAGVAGFYSPSTNPWQIGSLQAFRTEFYSRALEWLATPSIKTYAVCDVFVWGMASWDLFGIYPDSSTAQGTYRDADMVRKIARHNMKVIAAQTLASKGPEFAAMEMKRLEEQENSMGTFYDQESTPAPAPAATTAAEERRNTNNGWLGFLGK